jgi:hypothetical protein
MPVRMAMGIAALHPSYGPRLSQCEIVLTARAIAHEAGNIVSHSTPFPIPFLSVYWHTKPGADPCKNKSGSEAIGVR